MNKVVLIGCGNVGMAYAYSLVIKKINVDELVLIDINSSKAKGEALDLSHASASEGNSVKIYAGSYKDCDNASIICLCAGRNQEVGETRQDLIGKNYKVFESIIKEIKKTKFNGIFLVATNPLDTMTYITQKLSGFDTSKVIGSGTVLDTNSLRNIIANQLSINTRNVHAYVLGEHGDTEFIAWDNALIGANNVENYFSKKEREEILDNVRNSAYEIINNKGNTAYGIGTCLTLITKSIFNNEKLIYTVSCYDLEQGIYYASPAVIGKNGVERIMPVNLSKQEQKQLNISIKSIKDNIKSIKG